MINNELRPYENYQITGLDWLDKAPKHWGKVSIRGITQLSNKRRGCHDDLQLLSVYREYGVIRKSSRDDNHNVESLDLSNYKYVDKGYLVLNKMKMWQGSLGISKYEGIVSPAYIVCKISGDINLDYLNLLLRSPQYKTIYNRISYGVRVGQWDMRYDDFKKVPIFIPPRPEQDQIVKYLDHKIAKINKFIKAKKKLIVILKEQRRTIINEIVTKGLDPNVKMKPSGIDYIEMIPEGWRISRLGYIGKLQNGISEAGSFFLHGYPFVGYGDVYNNAQLPLEVEGVANSDRQQQEIYSVRNGDVFFTRTSETIEEIGISSVCFADIEKATFSGFLIRFRPIKGVLNKKFSRYYFRNDLIRHYFTKEMNIVIRASLSQNLLRNAPVILPQIDEQEKIAQFLDNKTKLIDNAIERLTKEVELISEYKNSLISEVVTGKVDIRHIAINDAQASNQEFVYETLGEEIMETEEEGDE
jgi:type I restriction enzyme S subunit